MLSLFEKLYINLSEGEKQAEVRYKVLVYSLYQDLFSCFLGGFFVKNTCSLQSFN